MVDEEARGVLTVRWIPLDRWIPSDGIRWNNGDTGLVLESVKQSEGVLQSDVNKKILTGHAEIGLFRQVLVVDFLSGGQSHVVCLSGLEAIAVVSLERGRGFFWRCFGIPNLSSIPIGVDGYPVDVTRDD